MSEYIFIERIHHFILFFFQTLHEKLIEELNKQIYVRAVQTQSMQRSGSARLSRKDASVWGWTDGTSNNAVPSRGGKTNS